MRGNVTNNIKDTSEWEERIETIKGRMEERREEEQRAKIA